MSAAEHLIPNEPSTPAEAVADEIDNALSPHEERRDRLIEAASKTVVTDGDSTGRAGDRLAAIKALREIVEQRRDEIRLPHAEAVRVANGRTAKWLEKLIEAEQTILGRIEDYRAAERDRIAAAQREQQEEEQRRRAERQPAAAPAPPPPPEPAPRAVRAPRVRGDLGSLVSDRLEDVFTIDDVRALPDFILDHEKVQAAIQEVCRATHKVMKTIPGVVITQRAKSSARK